MSTETVGTYTIPKIDVDDEFARKVGQALAHQLHLRARRGAGIGQVIYRTNSGIKSELGLGRLVAAILRDPEDYL
jgi:hypothetical protein